MPKPLGASKWKELAGRNQERRVSAAARARLACPDDDAPLEFREQSKEFVCPSCSRVYREREDGVLPLMPSGDPYQLAEADVKRLESENAAAPGPVAGRELQARLEALLWPKAQEAIGTSWAGKSVLVLGCGDGWLAVHLAAQHAEVMGLDADGRALGRAAQRRDGAKAQLDLLQGDVVRLPFLEQVFDVVISTNFVNRQARPERGMKEIGRVLRRDGVYLALGEPIGGGGSIGIGGTDPRCEGRALSLADYEGIFREGGLGLYPAFADDPAAPPKKQGLVARMKYKLKHRRSGPRLLVGRPREEYEPGDRLADYLSRAPEDQ